MQKTFHIFLDVNKNWLHKKFTKVQKEKLKATLFYEQPPLFQSFTKTILLDPHSSYPTVNHRKQIFFSNGVPRIKKNNTFANVLSNGFR